MIDNPFYLVYIGTLNRHEYHYGDDKTEILKIYNLAEEEVTDHKTELVMLHSFPNEDKMLEYIEDGKVFCDEFGAGIKFYQVYKEMA